MAPTHLPPVGGYAKKGIKGGSKIIAGFRDFLLRGNVVSWLDIRFPETR